MGTTKLGQMGQTRASALSCEVDVREEVREVTMCFLKEL
jgi:hypothetical protein